MKSTISYILLLLFTVSFAQEAKFDLYKPEANAKKDLENAVNLALEQNKHILIQVGGNWCGWCKLFHDLTTTDPEIKSFIEQNYIVYNLNYSKENQNLDVLEILDFPQRFGFPVFVILDKNGTRIHTQNSGYLEEGKGHSQKLVLEFLQGWSPEALNPENYKKK